MNYKIFLPEIFAPKMGDDESVELQCIATRLVPMKSYNSLAVKSIM